MASFCPVREKSQGLMSRAILRKDREEDSRLNTTECQEHNAEKVGNGPHSKPDSSASRGWAVLVTSGSAPVTKKALCSQEPESQPRELV